MTTSRDGLLSHLTPEFATLLGPAAAANGDIAAAIHVAGSTGLRLQLPGTSTAARWATLAALARADVTVARVAEAHSDALAILAEADLDPAQSGLLPNGDKAAWGVFAAEAAATRCGPRPCRTVRSCFGATSRGVR